jgi:hypothetical protein
LGYLSDRVGLKRNFFFDVGGFSLLFANWIWI